MNVRVASLDELPRLAEHYAAWGYRGGIAPADVAFVAEAEDGAPVGIVRQTVEHGVVMLRGMYVAPDARGRGIGSALLRAFVHHLEREPRLRGEACWGIPFAHLERFYARGDFAFVPADSAPSFLRERVRRYMAEGHRVAVMRRDPHPAPLRRAMDDRP